MIIGRRVARNLQWGGCLGAKPPAAGGWGFGGKAHCRRKDPHRSKILHFFAKITSF